jgi:CheY-like chemotaxis protein
MVLQEEGHEATGVSSPDEALQLLAVEKFGVIVTEYKLAGITAADFIARLREVAPGTVSASAPRARTRC